MLRLLTVLSSRGLAAIVLVGGVVLALPFIRREADKNNAATFDSRINVNELSRSETQQAQPASTPVSAALTATETPSPVKPANLPNWVVSSPPPMQLLLRETNGNTPKTDLVPRTQTPLQPLRPWIAEPQKVNDNELIRLKASPPSMVQKADNSSPWNLGGSIDPARNALAVSSHSADWPDQRMLLQDINQLVHQPNPRAEMLHNSQPVDTAVLAPMAAPIQRASLTLAGEQAAQPIPKTQAAHPFPKTDRPRKFIFQPGMKR